MSTGAAAGGSAAAAVVQAMRAMGCIVELDPGEFEEILYRQEEMLVVHSSAWLFGTRHKYLTSYKGLAFYCHSRQPLALPPDTELIESKKIWIPGTM
jgi:hypothetical protein